LRQRKVSSEVLADAPAGPQPQSLFDTNEISIVLGALATVLVYIVGTAITQSSDSLWLAGMRYASPVLPLAAMVAAIAITKISRDRTMIALAFLFVFAFTKLAQLTPWVAFNPSGFFSFGKYSVGAHVPAKIVDRFLGSGLFMFVRDLWRENPGTVEKTCKF